MCGCGGAWAQAEAAAPRHAESHWAGLVQIRRKLRRGDVMLFDKRVPRMVPPFGAAAAPAPGWTLLLGGGGTLVCVLALAACERLLAEASSPGHRPAVMVQGVLGDVLAPLRAAPCSRRPWQGTRQQDPVSPLVWLLSGGHAGGWSCVLRQRGRGKAPMVILPTMFGSPEQQGAPQQQRQQQRPARHAHALQPALQLAGVCSCRSVPGLHSRSHGCHRLAPQPCLLHRSEQHTVGRQGFPGQLRS